MHAPSVLAPLEVGSVWVALAEIPDPEIPTISIVDLASSGLGSRLTMTG